jgi:hypothetical protein
MPFTPADFLDVFGRYNATVWPTQLALLMVGAATVLFAVLSTPRASIAASILLAALWLWMGIAYHLAFFSAINPLAPVFAAAFIVQGVLILVAGAWRRRINLQFHADAVSVTGALIIAYALVGYPVVGYFLGHRYPATPTFGVPCPTTIFTFGVLVLAKPPVSRTLLVIPCLWAVAATLAVRALGMYEDLGVPIAALIAVGIVLARGRGRGPAGRTLRAMQPVRPGGA